MMKSAVGAVFNVKKSRVELILGIPPLHIQNSVNQIKHLLKLNIHKYPDDKLRECIHKQSSAGNQTPVGLRIALKQVVKFLRWKMTLHDDHFSDRDREIIQGSDISQFLTLSGKSCTYSKRDVTKYTELLWYESIRNEFMCEGHSVLPVPSCKPLQIRTAGNREEEVLLMSLTYDNNLLNGFLHKVNPTYSDSPLCYCGDAIQTPVHVLFQCSRIPEHDKNLALMYLQEVSGEESVELNSISILNAIRDEKFVKNSYEYPTCAW